MKNYYLLAIVVIFLSLQVKLFGQTYHIVGTQSGNNFTDQWYELQQAVEGTDYLSVDIEIKREDFAQGIDNIRLDGSALLLHFVRKDSFTDEIDIVDFNLVLDNVQNQQAFGGKTINGTFKANALSGIF
jgi:hypothetical protein